MNHTRLDQLSDGIFAIVMTILVFEIKVPVIWGPIDNLGLWLQIKQLFPLLDEKDFKGIEFGKDLLSYQLYNKSETATAVYNKQLKRLQKKVFGEGFRLQITSHLARHTYTNIQIDKNIDLFDLSISLGHKSLITTQLYINKKLHKDRVVKANFENGKNVVELQPINKEYKEMLIRRAQTGSDKDEIDLPF